VRFVLVSRFFAVEPGRSASAAVRFDPEDEVFEDHFPGMPLVPGTLLVEAMGQAAGGMLVPAAGEGRWPLLVMIEQAKFRRPVRPGDDVRLEANVLSTRGDSARVRTAASVGGQRVAEATLVFHAVPLPEDAAKLAAFREWAAARLADTGLGVCLGPGPDGDR